VPFVKHETFHIREGWLFKGMAAINAEQFGIPSTIFLNRDAPEKPVLG
jgi:hypothetical protein